jgi:Zn-dependent M32 family carboxypeptidase
MSEEEKSKIVWEGAKALIAGAAKYDVKKSIPPIYSALMENAPWENTVDWVAGVLKKYGQDKTTKEVLAKAVGDFMKEGGKNQPAA